LINEQICSITVEPPGSEGSGIEYFTVDNNGNKSYYQCKSGCGGNKSWSISSLKSQGILDTAKEKIEKAENASYNLISPCDYDGLDSLCNQARTCGTSCDLNEALSSDKLKTIYEKIMNYYQFDADNPADQSHILLILQHMHFEFIPDTDDPSKLEILIGSKISGPAESVRILLANCINDKHLFGIKIVKSTIREILLKNKYYLFDDRSDPDVLESIDRQNTTYWPAYNCINNKLIHRSISQKIISKLESGRSIILHGKAGCGKSGCLEEVIQHLKDKHIQYLSIKLDQFTPKNSAYEYGVQLQLKRSPVYAIDTIAGHQKCVLILDQLDSIRSGVSETKTAFSVCKEMFQQAAVINHSQHSDISIICVTRTFDLENRNEFYDLFSPNDMFPSLKWENISVDPLSNEDVLNVLGHDYYGLSSHLKTLLSVPANLLIWTNIEPINRNNSIDSENQLISKWWEQILSRCTVMNISNSDLNNCKDMMVKMISQADSYSLSSNLLSDYRAIVDMFISEGLLVEHCEKISFTHQIYLDYFISRQMVFSISNGTNLSDIITKSKEQSIFERYRLLLVLQNLQENYSTQFLSQCTDFLSCTSIHYYYKCAVFEVIGQINSPNKSVKDLSYNYYQKSEWKKYVISKVYYGHNEFIEDLFIRQKHQSLDSQDFSLLHSISSINPDWVTEELLKRTVDPIDAYNTLGIDIISDSEKMFSYRKNLLEDNFSQIHYIGDFESLVSSNSERAVELLEVIINHSSSQMHNNIEYAVTDTYINKYYQKIISSLYNCVCIKTKDFKCPLYSFNFDSEFRTWVQSNSNNSFQRSVVNMLKKAFSVYIRINPSEAYEYVITLDDCHSMVGHEIVMYALSQFSTDYSEQIIDFLLHCFGNNEIFDYTGNDQDYLSSVKTIIKKHSASINSVTFSKLENSIYQWKDDKNVTYKEYHNRLLANQIKDHEPVYYPYFWHFQKELLPCLDHTKISEQTKQLINVLNRNKWLNRTIYSCVASDCYWSGVYSPLDKRTSPVNDQTWLRIIGAQIENKGHNFFRSNNDEYEEATPESFSSTLRTQAKLNPKRFLPYLHVVGKNDQ
jgi:ABC-type dipeptide/oligopeptide/nickel transport system ATPase component